jgi:hypothetical protein
MSALNSLKRLFKSADAGTQPNQDALAMAGNAGALGNAKDDFPPSLMADGIDAARTSAF